MNAVPKDVFISYRRSQTSLVRPALLALEAAGIRCFFDQHDIDPLAPFPLHLRAAIDSSLAMLIWWSDDYAQSEHCLAEFRRAWQHTRRQSSQLDSRLWLLNPLNTVDHIAAGELGAQNFLQPPQPGHEAAWAQSLASALAPRLAALRVLGTMADERNSVANAIAPGTLHGVPQLSTHFTGRNAVLMRIHSRLHPAKVGAQVQDVAVQTHGLAGIGKTELATAYAREFAPAYPGGVFWIKLAALDSDKALNQAKGELAWLSAVDAALQYSPHGSLLRDEKGQLLAPGAARLRLAALPLPGTALWVLDNVPVLTPEPLRDSLLAFWRAPMADGRTLITTRDSSAIAGFAAERLDVMSPDDALRLLASFRPIANEQEEKAAAAIIERTGAHTQALVLLGQYIKRSAQGYCALLAELDQLGTLERIETAAASLKLKLGEKACGVLAAYAISLRQLGRDAKLLLTLASLCEGNIAFPAALLVDASKISNDNANQALDSLIRSALLTERTVEDSPLMLVEIHPLTAQVCLKLLPGMDDVDDRITVDDRPALRLALAGQLLLVLKDADDIRSHGRSRHYVAQARFLAGELEYESGVHLGLRAGLYAHAEGAYALARRDFENSLTLAKRVMGEEHILTLTGMNNLAAMLADMGEDGEARAMHEQILAIRLRTLGEEHRATLNSMNNLACTLETMGEYGDALKIQEKVLAARRRVLGEEHSETLTSMNNLAITLCSMGMHAKARTIQQPMLALQRRVLGDEHPQTLAGMDNLAVMFKEMGEHSAALKMFKQVLAMRSRMLGIEHPDTLATMNNLANTLGAAGMHAEARTMLEKVVDVNSRIRGEEHPATLTSMNNLASMLGAMGEPAAARAMKEKVLAARSHRLGEKHPDTLTSMSNLAVTLGDMGEIADALAMSKQALAASWRVLGKDHPTTLTFFQNSMGIAIESGDPLATGQLVKDYPHLAELLMMQSDSDQQPPQASDAN